jgi:hypothetical protein
MQHKAVRKCNVNLNYVKISTNDIGVARIT